MTVIYDPLLDGIEHINVYTKGATPIGRMLTNLATSNVKSLVDWNGNISNYNSLEGYWYWLKISRYRPDLKSVQIELSNASGFDAKKIGKKALKNFDIESPIDSDFIVKFRAAIRLRIRQDKRLLFLLNVSTLPFCHYYYFGEKNNPKVIPLEQYNWIMEEIELCRTLLQEVVRKRGETLSS